MTPIIRNSLIIAVLIVLSILIALVAVESASVSSPVMTINGTAYVQTDHGTQRYSDLEYISIVQTVKPMAINVIVPASLPQTSAPHGNNTCALVDNHGNSYTVSTDQPCEVFAQ